MGSFAFVTAEKYLKIQSLGRDVPKERATGMCVNFRAMENARGPFTAASPLVIVPIATRVRGFLYSRVRKLRRYARVTTSPLPSPTHDRNFNMTSSRKEIRSLWSADALVNGSEHDGGRVDV